MAVKFELRFIAPKKMNIESVKNAILTQLGKEEQIAIGLLGQTTKTWTGSKPAFSSKRSNRGQDLISDITAGGDSQGVKKWFILEKGSPPHAIVARRAPSLAFRQGGFRPKTKVKTLGSGGGRKATGPLRRPVRVRHPGSKAREWARTATERRRLPFASNMQKASNRGVNRIY